MKYHRGRGILLGGKEEVGGCPGRRCRPAFPGLASVLPVDLCGDRARRDEAACGATIDRRFSQRELADHLGLHHLTISVVVRGRELGKRQNGKTASKRRQGQAVDRDTNTRDLPRSFLQLATGFAYPAL